MLRWMTMAGQRLCTLRVGVAAGARLRTGQARRGSSAGTIAAWRKPAYAGLAQGRAAVL
jgi:hypothetical protein